MKAMSTALPPLPAASLEPPRASQYALGSLVVLIGLLIGLRWYTDRGAPQPSERQRLVEHQIDLNRASKTELLQLPGVGPARADQILAYRQLHGRFDHPDQLKNVTGIGDVTFQRLRPYFEVNSAGDDEPLVLSRKPVAPQTPVYNSVKLLPDRPIDLNRAELSDLMRLPGIGKTLAQRIIDERQKKPFEKVDELDRVSGIGLEKLKAVRPYVVIEK